MSTAVLERLRDLFRQAAPLGPEGQVPVALATADAEGNPSVRWVLLKEIDDGCGLRFYTHANSRKGRELAVRARAAVAMYWEPLEIQILLFHDNGTPFIVGTKRAGQYVGKYCEFDDHGRVLCMILYGDGKPIDAWSNYGGAWQRVLKDGTGGVDHFDKDGHFHNTDYFDRGIYTHGAH